MTCVCKFRNREKSELFSYARNHIRTFVYGPSGTGKTVLLKSVVEEVNDKIGKAIYVDCSLYPTANAVLRESLTEIGSVIASKSNYELIKRLKEKTRRAKVFFFLDHFESLKNNDILDILLGLDFYICLTTDSFESYRRMKVSHKAEFANILEIKELQDAQITEILTEEVEAKFNDSIIENITERSTGNLTLALSILRCFKANHGERRPLEHIGFLEEVSIRNKEEIILLDILKERERLPSGELYRFYREKSGNPKGERSFRKYMELLCKKGLVKAVGDKRGRAYEINGGCRDG